MKEMITERSTPMTSGLHSHKKDLHATDLSPGSSVESPSSVLSDIHTNSSSPTFRSHPQTGPQQLLQALNGHSPTQFHTDALSPLQRLQFAFERTSLLSKFFNGQEIGESMLIEPHSSSPSPKHEGEGEDGEGDDREGEEGSELVVSPGHRSTTPLSIDMDEEKGGSIPLGSPNSDPANIFQCPLCSIVCNGRHSFNEHLVTHTQHHACPKCDYLTSSEVKLKDHLQGMHDLSDPVEAHEEDETSVPKVNSQGKVKTYKCKQCNHISLTKSDSWAHSASHIRPEKILRCPKCQFVTEYKHHLEYHLRIHVGSKPYQCNVCSYTCVNKSMLNSHLKSHSAVYQFNCFDCDYQTKYCHSLKIHLRKMDHKPSMVLNPDGTPNPLPIIDVYGTRRGPKMKKTQPTSSSTTPIPKVQKPKIKQAIGFHSPANSSHSNNSSNGSTNSSHGNDSLDDTGGVKIKLEPMALSPTNRKPKGRVTPPLLKRMTPGSETSDSDNERKVHTSIPMSPITPSSTLHGLLSQTGDPRTKAVLDLTTKNPLELYAVALNQYLLANPLLLSSTESDHMSPMTKEQKTFMAHIVQKQNIQHQQFQQIYQFQQQPQLQPQPIRIRQEILPISSPISVHQTPLDLRHPKHETEKRKRKGKAQRYERHTSHPETNGEGALDFSNNNHTYGHQRKEKRSEVEEFNYTIPHGQLLPNTPMMCKYCEISFPDHILYRMHMSYHSGDHDPFLCKSCGKKTTDKVDFFLHLTTDSHGNGKQQSSKVD